MARGTARLDRARPDLAALHPQVAHAGTCGWDAVIDLRGCSGATEVALVAQRADGTWGEVLRSSVEVGPQVGSRRLAVFTIVQDESTYLPVWLRHYARQVDPSDLFVLDHDSADGSTKDLPFGTVVPVHRTASFDHAWLRATVEAFQQLLLRSYDAVIFAEGDELIVADPAVWDSLGAYVDALEAPAARVTGWNVVQHPDEQPWDPQQPLGPQRLWWHRTPLFDKTLVTRVPLAYDAGFHTQRTLDVEPDPGLILAHLHRVDKGLAARRHTASAARTWDAEALARNASYQARIVDPDELEQWFYAGEDLGDPQRTEIPERVRAAL